MRAFSGRLWLAKDPYSDVDVEVEIDLDEERLRISSNGSQIGDWSFDVLQATRDDDEVHLFVEGEELVIVSSDVWFAPAVVQTFAPWKRPSISEGLSSTEPEVEDTDSTENRRRRRGAHRKRGSFKLKW